MTPRTGVVPPAEVVAHLAPGIHDGVVDGSVLLLFVQSQMHAATVVDLDEVELTFLEIVVGIDLFVAIETDIGVAHITIADAATGQVAGIAVDACLQALRMDVVADHLQTVWKTFGVYAYLPIGRAAILESVVDVDVLIAYIFQSLADHRVGLTLDDVFRNVHSESVP